MASRPAATAATARPAGSWNSGTGQGLNTADDAEYTAWIKKQVDQAPPLTQQQRTALAELLKPVRRKAGAA